MGRACPSLCFARALRSLIVLFLLACSSVAPSISLPVAPAAAHAASLPLANLLTPTAFGASDDVLCPWARGEPAASASIPRWLAEGRLAWRVLRPDEPATFAERPLSEGLAVIDALEAVEARCGGEPGPRNYLIAASGTTPSGAVLKGMYEVGKLRFEVPWVLVSDTSPAPAPARPAAFEVQSIGVPDPGRGDTGLGGSSNLLDALLGVGEPPRGEAREFFTILVQDPPKLLGSQGPIEEPWLPWLTRTRPAELVVAPPEGAPWGSAVAVIDAAHGVGSAVVLAMLIGDANNAGSWPVAGPLDGVPGASVAVPWDGEVAALPIAVPKYR